MSREMCSSRFFAPTNQLPSGILRCIYFGDAVAILWHTAVYYFFFFLFFTKGISLTVRRGSARWAIESSAKHRFSIWQRAEKRKERLLSSSTPPHISPHPFHTYPPFVPSSLSIDLNVTQPWHGFTRLLARTVFYIFLLLPRISPFWRALLPSVIPRSLLLLYFPFCSLFFLAQSLRHCICIWWNTRCKIFPSHRTYGNRVERNGKRVESMRFCKNREIYFTIIRSSNNSRVKQSLDWVLRY